MKSTNLLIGKTNTGKTSYLIEQMKKDIKEEKNIVVFDEKGEYYSSLIDVLKEKEYTIQFLNLKDPIHSMGFNPLMIPYRYYKDGNIDAAIDLLDLIGHELFRVTTVDPYWENAACSFFKGLALTLFKEGKKEEINLGSIQTMIAYGEKEENGVLNFTKYYDQLSYIAPAYVMISESLYAPRDTRGGILSVLKQNLNAYVSKPNLLNVLCDDEIHFPKNKSILFITGIENKISNILIDQLIYEKIPMHYYLDSMNQVPYLSLLNHLVENADYLKSKVYVSIRSLNDFEEMYGKNEKEKFSDILVFKEEKEPFVFEKEISYPKHKEIKASYLNFEKILK